MADDSSAVGVGQLDVTYPVGAVNSMDVVDNQLRMLKQVWLTHFPNFTTSSVTADEAEFNKLDGLTATTAQLNLLTGRSLASTDDVIDNFPAGTNMLFQQTTAPTGWVKQTTHNDKALRVVSGTAGSGGSSTFSGTLVNNNAESTVVGGHSLTLAENGPHTHNVVSSGNSGSGSIPTEGAWTYKKNDTLTTTPSGSGTAHSHSLQLNVLYADVIIAKKS